jgi:hypothetical protein
MQPTRPATLAGVFVLCAVAAWLAVRVTFASLPLFPFSTIPVLLGLAVVETATARYVRNRLAGRGPEKPLAPLAVARLAALAKASSSAAVVVGGLSAGFGVYVLGQLDKTIPARDARVAGFTVASAVLLVAAALYLERCCRAPRPPEDQDEDKPHYDTWSWHQ